MLDLGIIDGIAILGWKKFVKEPNVAIESIVQEFYTNVPELLILLLKYGMY